jgi:TadE-like protein
MRDSRSEDGQASVELVIVLPLLAAVLLGCWQGVVAGQAWWLAASAARAGARADLVGADPLAAARRELPGGARERVWIRRAGDDLVVRLAIPAVAGLGRLGTATARVRSADRSS